MRSLLPRDTWEMLGRDWKRVAHPYLLWNRCPPTFTDEGTPEKGDQRNKVLFEIRGVLATAPPGALEELDRRVRAQAQWLRRCDAEVLEIEARQVEPLVSGQGEQHALEAGFCFHPLFGVPFLKGSSIKGAVRHAALMILAGRHELESLSDEEIENAPETLRAQMRNLFGTAIKDPRIEGRSRGDALESVGRVIVLDAFPVPGKGKLVELDVLTPHQSDFEDPIPVVYLVVPPGTRWRFVVAIRKGEPSPLIGGALQHALETWGLGGKTAAGHGRFKIEAGASAFKAGISGVPDIVRLFLKDVANLDTRLPKPAKDLLQEAKQKAANQLDLIAKAVVERLKAENPGAAAEIRKYCREKFGIEVKE